MIIYGKNAVTEALRAEKAVYKVYCQDTFEGRPGEVEALCKKRNIKIEYVDKMTLFNLCKEEHHQGFVAEMEDYTYCEVEDILRLADERGEQPFVVILDGVEDPHNFGAVLRVCEGAGVHGVIIPKHNACPINSTVAKTSAGALEHMLVSKVTNLSNTIEHLKKQGLWIYAVELGGVNIYQQNLKGAIGLVIGSEGKGISQLVKKNCDAIITMPMLGQVNSLNASVACGVAVFEVVRQRGK